MSRKTIITTLLFLGIIPIFSCSPPFQYEGSRLIRAYISAVQNRDYLTLYSLSADCSDEANHLNKNENKEHFEHFKKKIESMLREYEKGREQGKLLFDDQGVILIKAFVLGKGTFYKPVHWRRISKTDAFIDTIIEFGYGHINYSSFPEGTVIYLMGYPLGQVEKLTILRSGKVVKRVLKEAKIRWWFEKGTASELSPSGWHVSTIEIQDDSVTYETVTWIF